MEAELGEKLHNFYGPVVSDLMTMGRKSGEWDLNLNTMGKKSVEWDLNEWGWDGDLFMAAPRNSVPSDCTSRQFFPVGSDIPVNNGALSSYSLGSDEVVLGNVREKRDLEKRRRTIEVENDEVSEEARSLNLKLGGQVYPVTEKEEKSGKKTKICGATSSRIVCQVEDCKVDLSNAKDYHRRHKVCDVHSKATSALVGNVMQRFCQQCSRFHLLEEFDEGKRSCRRRLAGHNKRRRKTHPENAINATTLNNQQDSNYLLISLLRILSNIQTNSSDQIKDQDLLPHLLRNLSNLAGTTSERNHGGTLPVSQDLENAGTSLQTVVKDPTMPAGPGLIVPASDRTQRRTVMENVQDGVTGNASASQQPVLLFSKNTSNPGKTKLNNIDLNNVYDGSQDYLEDLPDTVAPGNLRNASSDGPLWLYKDSQQSSPPQNSGNSSSTLSQSLSTSSGEAQSRTDRIVFKLFGKDPSHFPLALRKQILDWLSSSPTDIESYIRPGCIILTIYLCMDKFTWEELYSNLTSSLTRLLESSNDSFWKTGWIYSRVGQHVTFVYNGQIVLETPLPLRDHQNCGISSIRPIAVSTSDDVKFVVKGFNLSQPASRLLCELEGKYLVQENCADMTGEADSYVEHDGIQSLSFSCAIPNIVGRGFIEVEDHALGSSFFPFIVAEKDVCSEIRTLESIVEATKAAYRDYNLFEARNQALDFIHEMGWLLHKSQLKFRLEGDDVDLFSFKRFRWLIEFAIDHNWCAVVKKLLSTLFDGIVDAGQQTSVLVALMDICLLHRAVRKNCRPMVEFLLKYQSKGALDKTGPQHKQLDEGHYLFRPDSKGPGGLTPLHIAACLADCENVLDALTEDPGLVGLEAWKNARDDTGLTPHDHASFSCHYSYIHLVQRKLDKKSGNGQVVIDIPNTVLDTSSTKQKTGNARILSKLAAFQTEKNCRQCEQKLKYGRIRGSLSIYRPTMLSMVAIAAVCVCAALLFKSSPEVLCSFRPFRWELLKYGSQ